MDRNTLPPPTMDLSAIVNQDEGLVLPRRSSSIAHAITQPSPVSASSKMATPTPRAMALKRKRHEPKPIWAYREKEELSEELQRLQEQQRQQARPPPPPVQPPAQRQAPAHRPGPPPAGAAAAANSAHELSGYERPVSDDAQVYDDVTRKVCDFIWTTAVNNDLVRKAIQESPHTQLEVEARWGQIIDKHRGSAGERLRGVHDTECVVRKTDVLDIKFESTMTMEQHKRMNKYLNGQVQSSVPASGNQRPEVKYHHTKEIDQFYDLGQTGFDKLPPTVRVMIAQSGKAERVRVSVDAKTGHVIRKMIKLRIANLEISSPQTEWDYRIGINLEINYPGAVEELEPSIEKGKTLRDMQRQKDRMSYSWLGAYQIDLTQVVQGPAKNHELELELDSQVLMSEADKVRRREGSGFESLINGMLNNLRVLSREITPQGPT
ncbi:CYTH-like domain-containing protein [Boeremia exigua]|uniref:CYTH-like domain-containing protein n=1 Tax=Boeremia exigua TaxID=749465 RepID=UPI001E8CAEA2|nr:CYTH-like domain-containing protein [Boeremia exigua]KAH6620495.1 CYTH-like domain-containing protein [Boeremia exigua]